MIAQREPPRSVYTLLSTGPSSPLVVVPHMCHQRFLVTALQSPELCTCTVDSEICSIQSPITQCKHSFHSLLFGSESPIPASRWDSHLSHVDDQSVLDDVAVSTNAANHSRISIPPQQTIRLRDGEIVLERRTAGLSPPGAPRSFTFLSVHVFTLGQVDHLLLTRHIPRLTHQSPSSASLSAREVTPPILRQWRAVEDIRSHRAWTAQFPPVLSLRSLQSRQLLRANPGGPLPCLRQRRRPVLLPQSLLPEPPNPTTSNARCPSSSSLR